MNVFFTGDPPLESYQEKASIVRNSRFISIRGDIMANAKLVSDFFMNRNEYPFIYSIFSVPFITDLTFIEFSPSFTKLYDFFGNYKIENEERILYVLSKTTRFAPKVVHGYQFGRVKYGKYSNDLCEILGFKEDKIVVKVVPRIRDRPPRRIYRKLNPTGYIELNDGKIIEYSDYKGMMINNYDCILEVPSSSILLWSSDLTNKEIEKYIGVDINFLDNITDINGIIQDFADIKVPDPCYFLMTQLSSERLKDITKIVVRNYDIYEGLIKLWQHLKEKVIKHSKDGIDRLLNICQEREAEILIYLRFLSRCRYSLVDVFSPFMRVAAYGPEVAKMKKDLKSRIDYFSRFDDNDINHFLDFEEMYSLEFYSRSRHPKITEENIRAFEDYFKMSDKVDEFIDAKIWYYGIRDANLISPADENLIPKFHLLNQNNVMTPQPTPQKNEPMPHSTPQKNETTPQPTPQNNETTPQPTTRNDPTPKPTPQNNEAMPQPTPQKTETTPQPTPQKTETTPQPTPQKTETTPQPTTRNDPTPKPTSLEKKTEKRPLHEHSLVKSDTVDLGLVKSWERHNVLIYVASSLNRYQDPVIVQCKPENVERVEEDKIKIDGMELRPGTVVYCKRDVSMKVLRMKDNIAYCIDFQDKIVGVDVNLLSTNPMFSMVSLAPVFSCGKVSGVIIGFSSKGENVVLLTTRNEKTHNHKANLKREVQNKIIEDFMESAYASSMDGKIRGKVISYIDDFVLILTKESKRIWVPSDQLKVDHPNEPKDSHDQDPSHAEQAPPPAPTPVPESSLKEGAHVLVQAGRSMCYGIIVCVNEPTCCVQLDGVKTSPPVTVPISYITNVQKKS